jgi:hypothetical protein
VKQADVQKSVHKPHENDPRGPKCGDHVKAGR